MDLKHIFIPITKVDAARRLVYGVATAEVADRANEVCDYASTRPYYEKWSGEIAKATDGKSLGNLRVMHGNVAAGKLTALAFNDDARQIEICAKVVDEDEWRKVEEGVYTGFSHGGRYVKRWQDPADPALTRYTAEPVEVSLVDVPCLPSATFEMIKDDGTREQRAFKGAGDGGGPFVDEAVSGAEAEDYEQVWQSRRDGRTFRKKADLLTHHRTLAADAAARAAAGPALDALQDLTAALAKDGAAKRAYTDAQRHSYAQAGVAMADGSFPIPDRAALQDAIAAHGRAKNPRAARRHIVRRAKALGATALLPQEWQSGAGATKPPPGAPLKAVRKAATLEGVAELLHLLAAIECAEDCAETDEFCSGAVALPAELKTRFGAALVELGDIAAAMLDTVLGAIRQEEAAEAVQRAAPLVDLMKAGARNSQADLDRLTAIHDLTVALGVDCTPKAAGAGEDENADEIDGKAAPRGALAKTRDALAHTAAERDALRKVLDGLPASLAALKESVDTLKAERDGLLQKIAASVKAIEEQPAVAPPRAGYVVNKDGSTEPLGGAARGPASRSAAIDQVLDTLDPQELALALIRKAHQNPQPAPRGW